MLDGVIEQACLLLTMGKGYHESNISLVTNATHSQWVEVN